MPGHSEGIAEDVSATHQPESNEDDAQPTPTIKIRNKKSKTCRTWWFVEPVLIVYFFSEFPVDFVGQKYILDWVKEDKVRQDSLRNISHASNTTISPCDVNISSSEYEFQQSIQSYSSNFAVVESIVSGVPATIVTILLGVSSDRFGRRFAILPPLLGVVISSTLVTLVVYFKASIYFFFISDVLYGCCGSYTAMTMGCFSYVADRTTPDRRMIRITLLEMCMLISGVVSPICLGPLINYVGYVVVLFSIALISTVNFLYSFFFLRDDGGFDTESTTISDTKDLSNSSESIAPLVTDSCTAIHNELALPQASETRVMDDSIIEGDMLAATGINYSPPVHLSYKENAINYEIRNDDGHSSADCDINSISNTSSLDGSNNFTHYNRSLLSVPSVEPANTFSSKIFIVLLCSHLKSSTRLFTEQPRDLVAVRGEVGTRKPARNRRFKLNILLLAFFITNLPTFDFSLATLFEMNSPLCWNVNMVGLFAGVSLGISTFGAMIVTPIMKCCLADHSIALIASAALVSSTAYKAFVTTTLMMMISPSLSMFSILVIPSIRSIMSSLVGENEQGAVFGVIACTEVICSIIGTIIFNSVYSATISFMTGFVFLVMSMFYAAGGICLVVYVVLLRCETNYQHLNNADN